MDKYNDDDRNLLAKMAEDIFDLQYKFGDGSICYMMLQHARDCLLVVDEISEL